MSSHSVITVIGKDRIGIVYDVSKLLAENQINILNISQQLMDNYFTMIILADTAKCPKSRQEMLDVFTRWTSVCRTKSCLMPCTGFKGRLKRGRAV